MKKKKIDDIFGINVKKTYDVKKPVFNLQRTLKYDCIRNRL